MKLRVDDRGPMPLSAIDDLLETCELLALVVRDPEGQLGLVMLCPPSAELAIELSAAVRAYAQKVFATEQDVTKN